MIVRTHGFKVLDQVIYIPNHATGPKHPDVEYGFITSVRDHSAAVRYWSNAQPGVLRTTANSEMTSIVNLRKMVYTDDKMILAVVSAYKIDVEGLDKIRMQRASRAVEEFNIAYKRAMAKIEGGA